MLTLAWLLIVEKKACPSSAEVPGKSTQNACRGRQASSTHFGHPSLSIRALRCVLPLLSELRLEAGRTPWLVGLRLQESILHWTQRLEVQKGDVYKVDRVWPRRFAEVCQGISVLAFGSVSRV